MFSLPICLEGRGRIGFLNVHDTFAKKKYLFKSETADVFSCEKNYKI